MKYVNVEDRSIANGVAASKYEFPHMVNTHFITNNNFMIIMQWTYVRLKSFLPTIRNMFVVEYWLAISLCWLQPIAFQSKCKWFIIILTAAWLTVSTTQIFHFFIFTHSHQFQVNQLNCKREIIFSATIRVRLGEYNTTDTENTDRIDFNVATIYQHPNYSSCYGYDDIALVKLDQPVTFTKAIRPACLPEERISNDIVNATATGWGLTESGPYSNILMKVNLDMLDDDKCKSGGRLYPDGVKTKAQFCAGSTNTGNTCSGDSGQF